MLNIIHVNDNFSAEADSLTMESELRITAIEDPPYISVHLMSDGSYRYEGYLFDVWEIIAQTLNLRYRLVPLVGGTFGRLDENGTWTGMVGELAYGRADVALTWLWIRSDRSRVISYLDAVPVEQTSEAFYLSMDVDDSPGLTTERFGSLLKPLDSTVWWTLLVTLLVISLVLKGTVRLTRRTDGRVASELTWATCLFSGFMSLVGQGWPATPGSLAGRSVAIFTWALGIIIVTSYTANLISHLTVVGDDRPISSLREFSERPDWKIGSYPDHIILNDWRKSENQYERELYDRIISGDRHIAFHRSLASARKMTKPKVLFFGHIEELFHFLGSGVCSMVPLFDQSRIVRSYISMAKGGSKLQHAMNRVMQRMHEAGILEQLKRRWVKRDYESSCSPSSPVKPLSLGDAMALLMIMPLGLVASLVICVLESVWFKRTARMGARAGSLT